MIDTRNGLIQRNLVGGEQWPQPYYLHEFFATIGHGLRAAFVTHWAEMLWVPSMCFVALREEITHD